MCAGCGAPVVVRQILRGAKAPVVVANATGCLEVSTTIYPYTSWNSPFIHTAFENAAASLSGVEAAYNSLKRQGKITEEIKFVAFGGDGGTYDIGLQSLSGAMERGHNMVYVCYDNGAYMNTGIQRSSATPKGADTTTTPVGKLQPGKTDHRKDLTKIMIAHGIPYVAQVAPSHWNDLYQKSEKAFAVEGPAFINALAPCPRGWRYESKDTIEMCRLAVDTCFWPLYEAVDGKITVTYKPRNKKPVADFLKAQGRFRHLFRPENEHILEDIQSEVDRQWEELLALEQMAAEQA
ncbi:MAG: pyruvate ferredoxin oxidoreductase [Firmicutes bacterium]|nr:pyruvate ferredoxin oxidoreductase [Candidatus Fermentithermobacillaceae bacterium]HON87682.1 thiamine pyrophosphate-dependent enzyme [Bacillota bacterium]HOV65337.1 thiamine pyrophosphate-dependent enzyme [Bacillota bacterium]